MMRAGRFDLSFFLDLPESEDRARLIEHCLRRYGRGTEGHDYRALAVGTAYLSHAEIVGGVEEALFEAAGADRADPTFQELKQALTPNRNDCRTAQ